MFLELGVGTISEPLTGRKWDPETTFQQVGTRAAFYLGQGMLPGSRVLLHFGNRLEFFADLVAIWILGGCAIPVDPQLTDFEVGNLARAATPRFSIVDHETNPSIQKQLTSLNIRVLSTELSEMEGTRTLADLEPTTTPSLDSDALILFTSGSTGNPKGVVHTHRSLRARWTALRENLGIAPYDRTLCLLPTHFGHGLICNCLFPWLCGNDLLITPPFKAELLTRLGPLIDDHDISFLSSVPSVWKLALKFSPPPQRKTLRRVHCGSAPLSSSLWEDIQEWSSTNEVFNAYGITETGSWVAGTTMDKFTPEDGLIGRPWGAVVKILRTSDTTGLLQPDLECKPGEQGHIWINTPALMKGYLDRDDLTREVVCNGWFKSGDIGLLDDKERLYLKGRERDEINRGGIKVYPIDIEAVLDKFPQALDACVFGYNDPLYGQEVGMALVLTDDRRSTIKALYERLGSQLAAHKVPKRWYLLSEIPRTTRGKVNREEVATLCSSLTPMNLNDIKISS